MRLTVGRVPLLEACQQAASVLRGKQVKPILQNVHLAVSDQKLTVYGTDLELGLQRYILSVEGGPGEMCIRADKLTQILREMPDDEVVLDGDRPRSEVRIVGDASEFFVSADNPSEYPEPGSMGEEEGSFRARTWDVREAFRRVAYAAAAAEHSRYGATTGILVEAEDGVARMVATDGRRLAVSEFEPANEPEWKANVVVPPKALKLALADGDDADEVAFTASKNIVTIQAGRASVWTLMVDGRFPNWQNMMPKQAPGCLVTRFSVATLLAAVRQASVMTDMESKAVLFDFAQDKLTLTARGPNSGRSSVEIPAPSDGAKKVKVALDPKYVRDMLGAFPGDLTVEVAVKDAASPVLFTVGAKFRSVIVPLVKNGGAE